MTRVYFAMLLLFPALGWAGTEEYARIESRTFDVADRSRVVPVMRSLITGGPAPTARFQDALAYYRIAEATTNKELNQRSIDLLERLSREVSNVYVFSYLGAAYASKSKFLGPVFGASLASRAKECFDTAVRLDPAHYLPRFYRGMFYLFLPGVFGGDEALGLADMRVVLGQMETIERDDDYKAFIYFIYGVYWGDKKHDYAAGLKYMKLCDSLVQNPDLFDATTNKIAVYTARMQ